MFDFNGRVDELRCRSTGWLLARRVELVREQRRLHVEELAVTAVLDERNQEDVPDPGVSERAKRRRRQTARRLQRLPNVANAAHDGDLSPEQLDSVTELADEADDREWAARGPNCSPEDLQRLARAKRKPTAEEGARRRAACELRFWWRKDAGMLSLRGELPDIDGALVESVLTEMIERMRPAKGQPWDTWAHRGADALVELCRTYADVEPTGKCKPHLVVHVPMHGPADIAGVPLDDATLEALRAQAKVEPVVVDSHEAPIAHGTARPSLPEKIRRAVLLRDGHCRWPGCERTTGLDIHHLWPRSWGGTDEISNLAAACRGGGTAHHQQLAPQGQLLLLGNPNLPDGLRLVHLDQLTNGDQTDRDPADIDNFADARAGPGP